MFVITWLLQEIQMMKANLMMRMRKGVKVMMMTFNSWLDLSLMMVGVDRHVKHDEVLTSHLDTQSRHPELLNKPTCTPCVAERLPATIWQ
jgi:hypothetical protein